MRAFKLACGLWLCGSLCLAAEPMFPVAADHPWNRLYQALYQRTNADGDQVMPEHLDANFTPRAKFLIEGESHRLALSALDDFLKHESSLNLKSPLPRAILQRDLWAVYAATSEPERIGQDERKALQARLTAAMKRLALSADEIKALPDNLDAACNAKLFPTEFDPSQPEKSFLPADLLAEKGSWVLLSNRFRKDRLTAPVHTKATRGRAQFLILLRLPAGREATIAYLKGLAEILKGRDELPQFPTGTQVALLRRMNLVDAKGEMQATAVTEGLQIRVYDDLRSPRMFEFKLQRRELLRDPARSLQPTPADESNQFDLGALGLSPRVHHDPWETPSSSPPQITPIVMNSCRHCHAGPGVWGMQGLFVDHFDLPPLVPGDLPSQVTANVLAARQEESLLRLKELWNAPVRSNQP